jgi:hypothetical protein
VNTDKIKLMLMKENLHWLKKLNVGEKIIMIAKKLEHWQK